VQLFLLFEPWDEYLVIESFTAGKKDRGRRVGERRRERHGRPAGDWASGRSDGWDVNWLMDGASWLGLKRTTQVMKHVRTADAQQQQWTFVKQCPLMT